MKQMTIVELAALQEQQELAILDVRDQEDFLPRHFAGSINIPEPDLEAQLDQLDSNQVYHVVCTKGIRAKRASQFLEEQGYDVVRIRDGWADYENGSVLTGEVRPD